MNEEPVDQVKAIEEQVEICAHCGAENPPGLLLCLACGRNPPTGQDLFTPPEVPMPDEIPASSLGLSYPELAITMPDPIQVPDPLPIPTLEEFIAPPPQPHPLPPPVYRAPPPRPKDTEPLLSPLPRSMLGLLGLVVLGLLGVGAVGSAVSLNLPNSICLGSVWLAVAVLWLGLMLAHRGESRNQTTGARRRVIQSMGQRLFEVKPGAAREQRAQLPVRQFTDFIQPASQLIYLSSGGDRTRQLTQVLLGTLCALVAGDHIEVAGQTYDVLTASPLRQKLETIKRTAVSPRTLYVGAGYLEKLILEQLRRSSTTPDVRDLTKAVLRQAGADLLDRVAAQSAETPPRAEAPLAEAEEIPEPDAQLAALREFCDEFKALNPDLYQGLSQEVEDAVHEFLQVARRRIG